MDDHRRAQAGRTVVPVGFPGCRLCAYRSARRPDVCLACMEASPGQGQHLRPARRCPVCGLPAPAGTCANRWCARDDRPWSVAWSVGAHAGGLRRAVLRYKYGGERWWAGVFGRVLAGWLVRHAGWCDDLDLLVGVPACTGPGGRRAWDPVGEVLSAAAPLLGPGWSVAPAGLVKRTETPALGRSTGVGERRAAVAALRRAVRPAPGLDLRGRRVLLVDDVLTEGSTAAAVASRLLEAGAAEVAVLVLARAGWRGSGPRSGTTGAGG